MAIPQRGMRDLKCQSARAGGPREPYRAFIAISALEMEKARRGRERESALQRIRMIDARFLEIEAEKASLLKEAASDLGCTESEFKLRGKVEKARRAAVLSRSPASGFTIKY